MPNRPSNLLIVGAGMSGLMTAMTLSPDRSITILDKGRSVGGRLATRRIGSGRADHGAQFFTVRDKAFATHVDRWLNEGLVFQWSTGWGDGSADATPSDGHPRYAVRDGMNAMAKHLAAQLVKRKGVDIQTGVTVASIAQAGEGWEALVAIVTDRLTSGPACAHSAGSTIAGTAGCRQHTIVDSGSCCARSHRIRVLPMRNRGDRWREQLAGAGRDATARRADQLDRR